MKKLLGSIFFLIYTLNSLFADCGEENHIPSEKGKSQVTGSLRGSGMCFTPNKGQIADMNGKACPDVLYKGNGAGADIYLRKTGISYVYSNLNEVIHEVEEDIEDLIKAGKLNETDEEKKKNELLLKESVKVHRVDMDFYSANTNIHTTEQEEVDGYVNYYYSYCPQEITNVHQYNKVTYKNIYDNIDVVYYGDKKTGVKYDIIVQPHADPNQIKLYWKGAESIHLNREGNLVIKTSINEFTESIPRVYQVINGKIIDVKTKYVLTPVTESEAIVTFSFSTYNSSFPLIIDPWATYYGGNHIDYGEGITTDNTGNVLVTGATYSSDFPVLSGFQMVIGTGNPDAFVVKLDQAGTRMWATYYGGSAYDRGTGISCDNAGNIAIAGRTSSPDFPTGSTTPNSVFQSIYSGGTVSDAFIVKLNSAGTRLWGTYYGGTGLDRAEGVAIDNSNNILITGYTTGNDFPVFAGFQMIKSGTNDAFVVKFDPAGTRLWATFYGGSSSDYSAAIATDNSDNLIITGRTASVDLPVLGGFQMVKATANDAFVVKFNPTGTRLWATFYGGNNADVGNGITTDNADNILFTGYTGSTNFPVLSGSQMSYQGGTADAYVVKLNPAGTRLWATFYGGTDYETGWRITTDVNNNVFLLMEEEDVAQSTMIADACSYQTLFGGVEDQLIVKFTPTGQKVCATFIGGTGEDDVDDGGGIIIYGKSLYITGSTDGGYPVTAGAFQTVLSDDPDAFITSLCINICESKTLDLNFSTNVANPCTNESITFTPAVNNSCDTTDYEYKWTFIGGTPATSTSKFPIVTYSGTGTYPVKLVITTSCNKDSVTKSTAIIIVPCGVMALATGATTCRGQCAAITSVGNNGSPPYTYSWSSGAASQNITECPASTTTYTLTITDSGGATATSTAVIIINSAFTVTASSTDIKCYAGMNGNILANAGNGTLPYTYSWSNGQTTQTATGLTQGNYSVTITDNKGCSTSTTAILSDPAPIDSLTFMTKNTTCGLNNGSITVNASGGTGLLTYSWNTGVVGQTVLNLSAAVYTITVADANSCTRTSTVGLTNSGSAPLITMTPADLLCNGSNTGSISVTLSSGTMPFTYNWSNGSIAITGSTSQQLSNLIAGIYSTTVTDANGCSSISSAVLTQPASLELSLVSQNITCANSSGSITLSAAGGMPSYAFNWSTGQTGIIGGTAIILTNLAAGNYSVTLTDGYGCMKTASAAINTTGPGTIDIVPIEQNISEGGRVVLKVSGGISYSWSPANGLSCTNCDNPEANPAKTTTYTVTATDINGCVIEAMITITVLPPCTNDEDAVFIANIFSPNNDGKNDILYIEGNGLTNIYWAIYDRWGNLLFETIDQSRGWDGTKNGMPVENGVYVYYLKGICRRTNSDVNLKGNVSIVK
ncbi:MAG: SBBP repeat-containing protein [Bacteroidetes bacterium]|nr:SBBP repeat-containing protein [Bacteroidota bacterium]